MSGKLNAQEINAVQGNKKFNIISGIDWFEIKVMSPIWGLLVLVILFLANTELAKFGFTGQSVIDYRDVVFALVSSTAIFAVILATREAYFRNEVWDVVKLVIGIGLFYFVVNSALPLIMIAGAYALGFVLARSASRCGELDWTPLVTFNLAVTALFINAGHWWFWVVPLVFAVIFQIAEMIRQCNWQSLVFSIFSLLIILIAILIMGNPTIAIWIAIVLTGVVIPTVVNVLKEKGKVSGVFLTHTINIPAPAGNNWIEKVRLSLDGAILTIIFSQILLLVSLINTVLSSV